jgi:hypothetical protein
MRWYQPGKGRWIVHSPRQRRDVSSKRKRNPGQLWALANSLSSVLRALRALDAQAVSKFQLCVRRASRFSDPTRADDWWAPVLCKDVLRRRGDADVSSGSPCSDRTVVAQRDPDTPDERCRFAMHRNLEGAADEEGLPVNDASIAIQIAPLRAFFQRNGMVVERCLCRVAGQSLVPFVAGCAFESDHRTIFNK